VDHSLEQTYMSETRMGRTKRKGLEVGKGTFKFSLTVIHLFTRGELLQVGTNGR